ncbi:extradiol dioxygenase [Microbacterium nanhaiense]|uniref:Extradiol dioxygenase n=1 Tax=Microbacterium nanhaiense TaxID=1301026 RepID=A0ABQ2MZ18_9MICO|nr:VOC family protein [Microbacterium nanhaiense]GGO61763.1 extradiol dioxygenase [Microbacterium nanhaiense]
MIFVNLPTTDLERSKAFYTALGCDINPLFTDENAACIVWDDDTFFMVLTHGHFSQFTDKPIADAHASAQVIVSFMLGSREEVDAKIAAGLAAGGSEPRHAQDYGFMYQRSIEDPDGNNLEFGYMDPQAAEHGPEAYVAEHGAGPDPVPGA